MNAVSNLRAEPDVTARNPGEIPPGFNCSRNLGCQGGGRPTQRPDRRQTSRRSVLAPLAFSDSTPVLRPLWSAYIWLVPMTWLLPALRLK